MLAASQSAQPTKSNASLWTAQSVLWPNGRCFVLFRSASTCNWEGLTELTQTRSRRLSTKAWLVGMEARMQVQHDACHVGTVHHVAIRCNMLQHSEAAAAEAKCQKNCKLSVEGRAGVCTAHESSDCFTQLRGRYQRPRAEGAVYVVDDAACMDRCQVPHRSINNASPGLRFCDSVVHRLVTDTTRAYWDRTQRWLRAVLSCGLCCDTVRYCAVLPAGRSCRVRTCKLCLRAAHRPVCSFQTLRWTLKTTSTAADRAGNYNYCVNTI